MWFDTCEASFLRLKELLTSAPILILLVEGESFVIYCDASHIRLTYVLMQRGQVIAYSSR